MSRWYVLLIIFILSNALETTPSFAGKFNLIGLCNKQLTIKSQGFSFQTGLIQKVNGDPFLSINDKKSITYALTLLYFTTLLENSVSYNFNSFYLDTAKTDTGLPVYILYVDRKDSTEVDAFALLLSEANHGFPMFKKIDLDWHVTWQVGQLGFQPLFSVDSSGEVHTAGYARSKKVLLRLNSLSDVSEPKGTLINSVKTEGSVIQLEKIKNGVYWVRLLQDPLKIYRWGKRAEIINAIETALLETRGFDPKSVVFGNGTASADYFSVKESSFLEGFFVNVSLPTKAQMVSFEKHLTYRILQLKSVGPAVESRRDARLMKVKEQDAVAAEQSGLQIEEILNLLDWTHIKKFGSFVPHESATLYSEFGKENLITLVTEERYERVLDPKTELAQIRRAKQRPLQPTAVENGLYMVYFKHIKPPWGSWGNDAFAIFKNLDLANAFIRTHRFVMENQGD